MAPVDQEQQQQPLKKYRGNCHCGAFIYEFKAPEIKEVADCNCSICRRKGYLFVMPAEGTYEVIKGSEDKLTTYKFGKGEYEHKFCGDCGTAVLCRSQMGPLINAHSIQDLNTWTLKVDSFDGAAMGNPRIAPKHEGGLPASKTEGTVTYTGSCHCGKLTLAVNCQKLDENYDLSIVVCNCSICERLGAIWIYPPKDEVVLTGHPDDLGRRAFASGNLNKNFCRTCGVFMTNEGIVATGAMLASRAEGRDGIERYESHSVNIRVLDDEAIDLSKLSIMQADGASYPPPYANP